MSAPSRANLRELLGHRVRVFAGLGFRDGDDPVAEGEVIAICFEPSIIVQAGDGTMSHHSSALSIEVMEWRPL